MQIVILVIKIDSDVKLTPIKLGDSNSFNGGRCYFAIGNPFGVGSTCNSRNYFSFK